MNGGLIPDLIASLQHPRKLSPEDGSASLFSPAFFRFFLNPAFNGSDEPMLSYKLSIATL
jgi:hypothetical protein